MNETLQQAITAIKSGNKAEGQRLLAQLLKAEPKNESAWLWMSAVVGDDTQRRFCLGKVLAINPANAAAQQALSRLGSHPAPKEAGPKPVDADPVTPAGSLTWPEEASDQPPAPPPTIAWPAELDSPAPAQQPAPAAPLTWPAESFSQVAAPQPNPATPITWPADESHPMPAHLAAAPAQPRAAGFTAPALEPAEAQAPKRPAIRWYDAWSTAILSPTVEGYQMLTNHAGVNITTPLTWIFIANLLTFSLVGVLLMTLLGSQWQAIVSQISSADARILAGGSALVLAIGIPLITIFVTIGNALGAGILHVLAVLLGGQGKYSQLLYASAAYLCPLNAISFFVVLIPVVQFLSLPISLFAAYLSIVSLRAVHRLSWGRAIATLLLPAILTFGCLCAYVVLMTPFLAGSTPTP